MTYKALLIAVLATIGWFAILVPAEAADRRVPPPVRVARVQIIQPVQDCGAFYEPYYFRGIGWGSGPGLGVGFGTFEGALPQYPVNSFPNWYGACLRWGHYIATGSAR
jgi:hypothetical protein